MLQASLTSVRGIGEKRAALLKKLGVTTVLELIEYLPRAYLDLSQVTPSAAAAEGETVCLRVRLTGDPRFFRKGGVTVVSVPAADDTGAVTLTFFNQPYRCSQLHAGQTVYVGGCVHKKRGAHIVNPLVANELPGILPVYGSVKGLSQRVLRDAVYAALKAGFDEIPDPLPLTLREMYALCSRQIALRHVHFPAGREILQAARERIAFEQALTYLAAVKRMQVGRREGEGVRLPADGIREKYLAKLPFRPTNAQLRAMGEIETDLADSGSMNRLLQGDVGSGKTAVALYAITVAAANGCQGALLAPTEILAEQHYESARVIFGDACVLLTGGMKKAARDAALKRIRNGTAFCAVGTHALLQGDVQFDRLGVIVTDEQHRFGVRQRAVIEGKGMRPNVLVMSATPIPRTLALLLYGDLDISVLDELPPGRKPVKTRVIGPEKRADMYRYILEQAQQGVQTYVVCPFIEPPEEGEGAEAAGGVSVDALYRELTRGFPALRIARLHGKLREDVKRSTIQAFRDGAIDVLITTTVIEVGVHVENASILVVEGAERFGLSQLHQLRGRVGRGSRQSYCFLLQNGGGETARQRMETLVSTNDGFAVAAEDLRQRGAGDLYGVRQHGVGDAAIWETMADGRMVQRVQEALSYILQTPDEANEAFLDYAEEKYMRAFNAIAMN